MKITRLADRFVFQMTMRDKHLFRQVLKLYPRMPPAHQQLTRTPAPPEDEANQRLLDEALAEHRAENKKLLDQLLADKNRYHETETGCRLSLPPGDVEWLLQVLNDIRIGSWVRLGSPEPKLQMTELNTLTARDFWAMELSGYFQMHFLEALKGKG